MDTATISGLSLNILDATMFFFFFLEPVVNKFEHLVSKLAPQTVQV